MALWHTPESGLNAFVTMSRDIQFPKGIGLPGRVWAQGSPAWIADVTQDPNFPRSRIALKEGLHGGFAFPVRSRGNLLGIIEVLTREIVPPDPELLGLMEAAGLQIGQFLQQSHLRDVLRETELEFDRRIKALEKARQELQKTVRTREDVMSFLAHDLKNPLHVIGMNATLVRERLEKDPALELECLAVDRISSAARAMQELIGDILDLARLESGHVKLNLTQGLAHELLCDARDRLEPLSSQRGHCVEVAEDPASLRLRCDRVQVSRVLGNLVGNAIKFTSPGGRIRLEVRTHGTGLLFIVTDTGRGIHPTELPRVFEQFWQARDTERLGSGLGLAISKTIVEAHGGTIWVESRVDQGSSFYFTLPC